MLPISIKNTIEFINKVTIFLRRKNRKIIIITDTDTLHNDKDFLQLEQNYIELINEKYVKDV